MLCFRRAMALGLRPCVSVRLTPLPNSRETVHSVVMAQTIRQEKTGTKEDQWRERIAQQGRSGMSVRQFCQERGLREYSFYLWRKRLRSHAPVRFALVEGAAGRQKSALTEASLELVLTSGERLCIGRGVDGGTLQTVLEALRR
jgi:transposase